MTMYTVFKAHLARCGNVRSRKSEICADRQRKIPKCGRRRHLSYASLQCTQNQLFINSSLRGGCNFPMNVLPALLLVSALASMTSTIRKYPFLSTRWRDCVLKLILFTIVEGSADGECIAALKASCNFSYPVPIELIPSTAAFLNAANRFLDYKRPVAAGTLDMDFATAVIFVLSDVDLFTRDPYSLDAATVKEIKRHLSAIETAHAATRHGPTEEAPPNDNGIDETVVAFAVSGIIAFLVLACVACAVTSQLGRLRRDRRQKEKLVETERRKRATGDATTNGRKSGVPTHL